MIKYAKVINEEKKLCQVGLGTNTEFYIKIGMTKQDVEQCEWDGNWYLSGYVPEKPEPTKDEKIAQYKQELIEIDEKSIRSLRAIQSGNGTETDTAKLAEYEARAEELRQLIKDLQDTES